MYSKKKTQDFDSLDRLSYTSRFSKAKRKFPIRTGLAAISLFTIGSLMIYASTLIGLDKERRGLSFFIIGLIAFIPGSYASVQLYGAYKGWKGYNYDQIPSYDD